MGFLDLILLPFYIFLFHWIFKVIRNTYADPQLRKYHKTGFIIKVLSSIAFTVFNLYISPGDSTGLYHQEGLNIYNLILKDPSHARWLYLPGSEFDETLLYNIYNTGYFGSESNALVIKLVAILSFATLGKYIIINLIFSMIAFTGAWKLFLFFHEQFPSLHKRFAIAILYMPTFVFWSSGVLKDSLCIACIGWLTYSMYEIFVRHRSIVRNVIVFLIFGSMLSVLKIYILISYIPIFMLFIIIKNMAVINNKFVKYLVGTAIIIVSLVGFSKVMKSFEEELGVYAMEDITQSIKTLNVNIENQASSGTAESNFNLGMEYDGSISGLVKLAPFAVGTTLFRPFLWEVHNPSSLMASLESLLMVIFTLMIIARAGPWNFIRYLFTDPLIMYCFFFAVFFAWFVGASTLNFGTLVRYKIPCMPFYLIALFLIEARLKLKAAAKTKEIKFQEIPAIYNLHTQAKESVTC